jgi:nitrous oxidase accessory protein NosD
MIDNVISTEPKAITISESHNNEIYNNTISNSVSGIDLDKESLNNAIHDNTIIVNPQSSSKAISVESGAEKNNLLYSNIIKNNIPP